MAADSSMRRKALPMMSSRRLALSVLCAASLATGLAAASIAPATAQAPRYGETPCAATSFNLPGTYSGNFENNSGDTLSVTFSDSSPSTTTQWTVEGWHGSGRGEFEFGPTGPQWTNSDIVTNGPVSGSDSEVYKSTEVTCDADSGMVRTITGLLDSGKADKAEIPFTITRR